MHGPKEKRKYRPAGDVGRGDAQEVLPPGTHVSCPRRGAGGGLVVAEWTFFSFRCRLPGAGGKPSKDGGQLSAAAHLARTEKEVR